MNESDLTKRQIEMITILDSLVSFRVKKRIETIYNKIREENMKYKLGCDYSNGLCFSLSLIEGLVQDD